MSSNDERKPTAAEVFAGLRENAFVISADQAGASKSAHSGSTWGLIMEMGYPNGAVSLVTFADGTTSIYFGNGGGVIGGGQHAEVRDASRRLLQATDAHLNDFAPAATHPLPEPERVRFYARTTTGLLVAEAGEHELGEGRHRLSPLFYAAHRVISHLRQISTARNRE